MIQHTNLEDIKEAFKLNSNLYAEPLSESEETTAVLHDIEPCAISEDYCQIVSEQKEKAIEIIQHKTKKNLAEQTNFSFNLTVGERNVIMENFKKSGFKTLEEYALYVLTNAKISVTI